MLAIVSSIIIGTVSFAAVNPEIGVYLILFSVTFSKKIDMMGPPVSTADIIFFSSLVGIMLNRAISKKRFIFKTDLTIPFCLLIFFLILSVMGAEGKFAGLRQFIKYSEMFLFFLCLINIIDSKERLYRLLWFLVAIPCLVSMRRLSYQIYQPSRIFIDKGFALNLIDKNILFFNNYALEAAYLNLIIFFPLFLYLMRERLTRPALLSLVVFLILFIDTLLIFSRGSFLGFIGGLLITIPLSTKYISRNLFFRKLIILLSIVGMSFLVIRLNNADSVMLDKLSRSGQLADHIIKKDGEVIKDWRIRLAKTAFQNIKEHPFLGIGAGNYIYRYFGPQYLGKDEMPGHHHVHNLYLHIWMEMGIFALCSYLWLIVLYFRRSLKIFFRYNDISAIPLILGSIGAVTSFSLHNLVDVTFFHHIQLLFILMLAIPYLIERSYAHSKERP